MERAQDREGLKPVPTTDSKQTKLREETSRPCIKGPAGKSLNPDCVRNDQVVTEIVFMTDHAIPMERAVKVNGVVVEHFLVLEFKWLESP